jgi:hypothetical protein
VNSINVHLATGTRREQRVAGLPHFLLDHLRQARIELVRLDQRAVDPEHRQRAAHAQVQRQRLPGVDLVQHVARVHPAAERVDVDAHLLRVLLETRLVQLAARGVGALDERPELVVLGRRQRGLGREPPHPRRSRLAGLHGRGRTFRLDVVQREVVAEPLEQLIDLPRRLRAVGALQVRELDDRHQRVRRALARSVADRQTALAEGVGARRRHARRREIALSEPRRRALAPAAARSRRRLAAAGHRADRQHQEGDSPSPPLSVARSQLHRPCSFSPAGSPFRAPQSLIPSP